MQEFDLLIRDGMIVDGSGRPAYKGNVGIIGDEIVFVGNRPSLAGKKVIDATGKVIAPGFIDVHAHSDYLLLMDRQADSKVLQGITTDIGGNCGLSPGPFKDVWYVDWWIDSTKNFYAVPWREGQDLVKNHGVDLDWSDLEGYFKKLGRGGIAVNFGSLVGHYVLRATAYGEPDKQPTRRPTPDELEKMKRLLAQALSHGALGFSVGFHHTDPELDVDPQELIELCKVAKEHDALFSIHLRSYSDRLLSAVREALNIAEASGVRTSIAHLMADGKENWGKLRPALDMIADARARGVLVYTDVLLTLQARNYMSGGLKTMLPDEVAEAGEGRWKAYFSDPKVVAQAAERMRAGIGNRWYKTRFYPPSYWPLWDEMLRVVECGVTKQFEGRMLSEVAHELGGDSFDAICHLLALNDGDAHTILERSSEEDITDVLRHPLSMVGSDGNPLRPLKSPRPPNPRIYGTFPRLFGHFVRDKGVLSLEQAVLKVTSLPAQFLGLEDRGELRRGCKADVVVFDHKTIRDWPNLTGYPEEYGEGIEVVVVNGQIVVDGGKVTGVLPGTVLKRERPALEAITATTTD